MSTSGTGRSALVSVVVVNYRGADDTITCLRSFDGLDWPRRRLELVVVDNASGDGSADRIRSAVPGATVIESPVNAGFAGGCNLGARRCRGTYLGFLNNDARPAPSWVSAAVDVLDADATIAAVASKVLDWEGAVVDYVDGSLTWFGMGYKAEAGRPDSRAYDQAHDVLFATGAAMFVRSDVYRAVGGFDERYFMFYEDVDLGWRLNLLGHRVRYVPGSIAYHRHHASMTGYGPWREHFMLERNALFTLYKNYDDDSLAAALPGALLLAVRRGMARGKGKDIVPSLDLAGGREGREDDASPVMPVAKEALVPSAAIDAFLDHLPALREDRRRLQSSRRRTDAELRPLFRRVIEPAYDDERYVRGHDAIVEAFGIGDLGARRRRVVVAVNEPLSARMAGPAIRAWAIAEALSVEHEVELVTLGSCAVTHPRFGCRSATERDLRSLERWCDILVLQGFFLTPFPWLEGSRKLIVVDAYNLFHIEQLEQGRHEEAPERVQSVRRGVAELSAQLSRADVVLCSSPRQRDFWLGQMAALGRLNPDTYDADPAASALVRIVPFGVPDMPPVRTGPAIRGRVPGIGADDDVILWGGGIYDWLDPLTLVHAVDRLRRRRERVRLFFLGQGHPNPAVPAMRMAASARDLSDSLGFTGTHVFFNDRWVDHEERGSYLLDADVGVSTHLAHAETTYAYRTRVLDYIWANLPVVATRGDVLSELVEAQGLGLTVPPADVEAMEDALFRLLTDGELAADCRRNLAAEAPEHAWSRVLAPLVELCRQPRRPGDLLSRLGPPVPGDAASGQGPYRPTLTEDLALARTYLQQGGPAELARRALGRARNQLRARAR